jgi:hypothetical protein
VGFQNEGKFFDVINAWNKHAGSVVYLIVLDLSFPRLLGSSDILYIGSTVNIGGNVNSRLWSYKYPASVSNEARISDYVKKLAGRERSVYCYFCRSPPNSMSVREYEMHLLESFRDDHWELPPWNSSIPRKSFAT